MASILQPENPPHSALVSVPLGEDLFNGRSLPPLLNDESYISFGDDIHSSSLNSSQTVLQISNIFTSPQVPPYNSLIMIPYRISSTQGLCTRSNPGAGAVHNASLYGSEKYARTSDILLHPKQTAMVMLYCNM